MKKRTTIILMVLFCQLYLSAQNIPHDSLYFGQIPPGKTPKIFAPGKISLPNRNEAVITFSPDGGELFFHIQFYPQPGAPYIMHSAWMENHWTPPDTIPFSIGRSAAEPIFSPDGERLYLYATNVVNHQGINDLSYSTRTWMDWTEPISLGNPPNSESNQYHPCVVADNSIYFSSSSGNVCRCQYSGGVYAPRVVLPRPVNYIGSSTWGDPYVAPDESFMLIKAIRDEGFGENDIYIAYHKSDGTWTNPKNLGSVINTPNDETSGDVTPDGLYMTYGSNKDLYWVSTSFIDSLRHTNFLPYVLNPVANQTATVNELYSFTIPDSTFFDDDGNNTLTYSARLSNGSPLPSWLTFDSLGVRLYGTPPAFQILNIEVRATDTAGAMAKTIFRLTASNPAGVKEQKSLAQRITLTAFAQSRFRISDEENSNSKILVEVIGLEGKKIGGKTFTGTTEIDLSNFSRGIFLIRITDGQESIVRKVMVMSNE